ncbi:MAG: hypothetical protein ACYDA3_14670 [Gaiellaceae bacterium]
MRFLLALALAAATPQGIVAKLNAQRVANGIPGGITLNPAWTRGCEHHVRYEELNGIPWTHEEVSGRPGFTKEGQIAAAQGDQAYTHSWDEGNPFENLPLHLASLLLPSLGQIGAFERGHRVCVMISPGYTRQIGSNAIYEYPGPGRSNVVTSQLVHGEWPFAPGDLVGLPQGSTTGPTIYVFPAGPWTFDPTLELVSAKLRGPHGSVAIRIVDGKRNPKLRLHSFGAMFLIPVSPLSSRTTYTATVVVSDSTTSLTKTWSFRTS